MSNIFLYRAGKGPGSLSEYSWWLDPYVWMLMCVWEFKHDEDLKKEASKCMRKNA